ncbi:MAG: ABC transporter substrate-binding protein [Anaerolineae bacterium]
MKRAFLVVSVLVVGSMLLSACAPAPTPVVVEKERVVEKPVVQTVVVEKEKVVEKPVVQTVVVEKVVTPTPKPLTERERTLIFSYPFESRNMDPHQYFEAEWNMAFNGVYEYMFVYRGPEAKFTPQLVESYETTPDGMVYTFRLRKGVKFHSGEDFNAETFKFNVDRLLGLNTSAARYIRDYVETVEVVDDYTVAFHLKVPTPGYHLMLAGNWAPKFVCPKAVMDNKTADDPWAGNWFQANMCGTGPYKFVSREPGQQLVLEKFDDYWGGWAGKHFDKMIHRIVPESSTQRMLLETGEIDLTCMPLEVEDIKVLQKTEGITCGADPTTLIYIISVKSIDVGPTGPIMSNKKVRQALAYAFNYDAALEDIMGIKGSRISDMLFNPAFEGYDPNHFVYTYDLDKAKKLLAEAGYPGGGFELELVWLEGFPDYPRIAEMYQADLASLGITLSVRGMPPGTFSEKRMKPETTADLWLRPRAASNPLSYDWIVGWTKASFPPARLNEGYWSHPEFEELYAKAKVELDDAKRAEYVRRAAAIASEEVPVIWIAAVNDVMCYRNSVKGQVHSPFYMYVYWPYDLYRE